jgi:hypothetical protein
MPAIVRQTMSRDLAKSLLSNILSVEDQYYIGIGKADPYNIDDTIIAPIDSPFEEKEFRNNLQSIKKIEGATMVTKRYNWSSGAIYKGWSDTISSDITEQFYVLNDAKEVYICLETGITQTGEINVSSIEPNYGVLGVDYTQPFTTGDGYTWKFLYSLTPESIFSFLSSNYIPVHEALNDIATGDPIEDLQFYVKQAAVGGQVIRAEIENTGSQFSVAPIITVNGDGTGATAVGYVSNGHLVRVEMTDYGSGYTHASFSIQGDGVDEVVRAVVTDTNGLGFDPINDLKTSSVLMNIKPNGDEEGTFIVENEFRQIGLIKNPLTPALLAFTDISAKVLPKITLEQSSPFTAGNLITGSQSGAVGYVNESTGNEVHFHQNEGTGFTNFQVGEVILQSNISSTGTVQSITQDNGIDRFTGQVLYIENRHRIRRDAEQQEDIKIVITI